MSDMIGPDDWQAADALLDRLLLGADPGLDAALADSAAAAADSNRCFRRCRQR